MYTPTLNYAQLRPKGIESNHFAYHLEQLVKTGLVAKHDKGYSLTTEGLAFADRASHHNMTIRKQPHIVSTIDITNEKGETLLFKHAYQPYLNLVGFPQGRLHYEERVAEAAQRELSEKTGLKDIPLKHRGIVYIYATKQGADISKIAANVFSGTVKDTPEVTGNELKGEAYWGKHNELNIQECMPGFLEIKALLAKNKAFFFTEVDHEMTMA